MAGNACIVDDERQAIKAMNQKMGEWKVLYHSAKYFGHALFHKKSMKNSIIEYKKKKRTLELDLDDLRNKEKLNAGERARVKGIKDDLVKLTSAINEKSKSLKSIDKKNQLLQDIESLVMSQMAKYAESSLYDINPDIIFGVLREWIQDQYTIPLRKGGLHELDIDTLSSVKSKLKKIYATTNKLAKKEDPGALGAIRNTLYDPAVVMFETDPTGLGYKLIKKTRTIQDDMNSYINGYKSRFKEIQEGLKGIIDANDIFYGGSPLGDSMTDDEKGKSLENLTEIVHEILDGESRYIKPISIYTTDEKGAFVLSPEFKEDEQEYSKKLKDAIDSGLMDLNDGPGEHIQRWTSPTGLIHYYIPIKHVQEDGTEVWNAYEVPWEIYKGKESLLYPPKANKSTRNKALIKKWQEFFQRDNLTDNLEEGWMQAQTFDHLNKMNKKKAIYTVHGHNNFIKTDKGDINKSVWQQIGSIRNLLREVREDVSDMVTIQENRFKEIVEKLLNGEIPTNMTDKELKSIIKEIKNLDSMNLNFAISGGSVISSNHYFNEMENYVPYMYAFTDSLLGFINARDDLTNKLENYEKEHTAAVNKGDNVEAIKKSLMVKEANEMIDIYNDKINVTLGLKDRNETENMNAVQLIKFVKSRSGFMNPLKIEKIEIDENDPENVTREIINNGRRKDFGVFTDYVDGIFRQVHHNGLKPDTLNAIQGTTKSTSAYLFDHVKASIGRLDVNAALFGLDYSDERVATFLAKMQAKWQRFKGQDDFIPITPEVVHNAAKVQNMWISGALLKWGSALTNNFQRASVVVESDWKSLRMANSLIKNHGDSVKRVVELSGVTDTVVAMADSLMGAAGDITTTSGMKAAKSHFLLKMEKGRFLKAVVSVCRHGSKEGLKALGLTKDDRSAAEWWADVIEGMIEGFDPKQKIDARALSDVAEGIWLATNKLESIVDKNGKVIKKPALNATQMKALKDKLSMIMEKDQLNKYVAWALGGGFISQAETLSGLAFTKVEERRRTETFLVGGMMADQAGLIPKIWKDKHIDQIESDPTFIFTHPEAQRFGRLLVYNTMFGLSPAYLPKAFRGAIGSTLFKFKPYQWHQMRNEWRTIHNWMDTVGEKGIGKAINNIVNPFKQKSLSAIEKKFRNLLAIRGTVSILSVGTLYIPVLSDISKAIRYRVLNSRVSSSMSSGAESAILSASLRTLHLGLALGGLVGDDEDEKIKEEWYRLFLPLFLNVFIDTIYGEDPFKVIQLYSRSAHAIMNEAAKVVD